MTRPVVSVAADDLYRRLGDGFPQGDAPEWLLLKLCAALAVPLEPMHELADTDWILTADPETAPDPAWLAQLVGLEYAEGLTDEVNRTRIRERRNWQRGTLAAFRAAIMETLDAATFVTIIERDGGAYKIGIVINAAALPDQAATLAAIAAAKPAGHTATLTVTSRQTYGQLDASYASYTAFSAAFVTYSVIP